MITVTCDNCHEPVAQFGYNLFQIKYTIVNTEKNAREQRIIEKQYCDRCTPVVIKTIESILQGEVK